MSAESNAVLDLRKEIGPIRGFLRSAVEQYSRQHPGKPVTGIHVFYALQNGFLDVYFWDNPSFKPFEQETENCRLSQTMQVARWQDYYEALYEQPTTLVTVQGETIETTANLSDPDLPECAGGEEVIGAIGAMLAEQLQTGRSSGLFQGLPMAEGCQFAVQDDEDEFIWMG